MKAERVGLDLRSFGMKPELRDGGFVDERGVIQDVMQGQVDGVTRIFTKAGAIRGNHYHLRTYQWTYVLTGRLLMAHGDLQTELGPNELLCHPPREAHAWRALEDTDCMVFTRGPRYGHGYEMDTFRLDDPLLS